MTDPGTRSPEQDDARIASLIAAWVEHRRAGGAEHPSELLARHPELAEGLQAGLAAVGALERATPTPPASPPPARLGEYRILREIGRGGMGVVYEAVQDGMHRSVALKVLYPAITQGDRSVARFQREARVAGQLNHTNIVTVHQLGQEDGIWFCAMELVEGRTLAAVLDDLRRLRGTGDEGPASPTPASLSTWEQSTGGRQHYQRVAEMFAGVADALHLAHGRGIIHRDVKPSNLILSPDGRLKVLDFGLARADEAGADLTTTGAVVGTPLYMSPEQVRGDRSGLDGRTDVYSLGATLYEVLTLRPPHRGHDVQDQVRRVLGEEPRRPRRFDPRIPRDLETIVGKALEKDRERRYASAAALAHDLRAFAAGGTIRARRSPLVARIARHARRHRARTAAALVAAASVVVAWVAFQAAAGDREARDRAEAGRRAVEYDALISKAQPDLLAALSRASVRGRGDEGLLDRAIALLPDRPEAWFLRAVSCLPPMARRWEDLARAQERGLKPPSAQWARLYMLAVSGRMPEALSEAAAGHLPADPPFDAWALRLGFLALSGRTPEAADLAGRLLRELPRGTPTAALALQWGARAFLARGDPGAALEMTLALRTWLQPEASASVEVDIAAIWKAMGRTEDAEARLAALLDDARSRGTADAWRELAEACNGAHEFPWTVRVAEQGLRIHPDDPALLLLGATGPSGTLEDRLRICDRVIAAEPGWHMGHHLKASLLRALDRFEDAREVATRGLDSHPNCPHCLLTRGVARAALGDVEAAKADFAAMGRWAPWKETFRVQAGMALHHAGDAGGALEQADLAVAARPTAPGPHLLRSQVLADLEGRLAEAIDAAERAAELAPAPEEANAKLGLAKLLLRAGRAQDAVEPAKRAVALLPPPEDTPTPDESQRTLTLASALAGTGKVPEACALVEGLRGRGDDHVGVLLLHGQCLEAQGRWEEAAAAWRALLAKHDDWGCGHWRLGVALRQVGRLVEAEGEVRRALAVDLRPKKVREGAMSRRVSETYLLPGGDAPGIHEDLGLVLFRQGRFEEAVEEYARARSTRSGAPAPPEALRYEAMARVLADRVDDAAAAESVPLAEEAVRRAPAIAGARLARLAAYVRVGAWEAAEPALREEIRQRGEHPFTLLLLAQVEEALGHGEQARAAYDRAVSLAGGHSSPEYEALRRRAESRLRPR